MANICAVVVGCEALSLEECELSFTRFGCNLSRIKGYEHVYINLSFYPDHVGKLHVLAVQRVPRHLLDLHVQEGAGDKEQNIR